MEKVAREFGYLTDEEIARPEIRLNDDKSLDEIIAQNAVFHLEKLDDNVWWISVESGGKQVDVWLRAKGKIKARFEESVA